MAKKVTASPIAAASFSDHLHPRVDTFTLLHQMFHAFSEYEAKTLPQCLGMISERFKAALASCRYAWMRPSQLSFLAVDRAAGTSSTVDIHTQHSLYYY